jgi:hypothetical protein
VHREGARTMIRNGLVEAVAAALRAPSLLNSQPWRWRLAGDAAELWADGTGNCPTWTRMGGC